jgi:hypothetical protein
MRCKPFAMLAVATWAAAAVVTVAGHADAPSAVPAERPAGTCAPATGLPPKG